MLTDLQGKNCGLLVVVPFPLSLKLKFKDLTETIE